jgi:hypothetical protein
MLRRPRRGSWVSRQVADVFSSAIAPGPRLEVAIRIDFSQNQAFGFDGHALILAHGRPD